MAFENPIGNPLEPRNFSNPLPAGVESGANHFEMIGDSSAVPAACPEPVDGPTWPQPRHLSLVPNDFDELFDSVEEQWQERALCAQTDPEAFFPEKGGSTREAKRICQGCEVKSECLEYALHNDERFGIWGGLSERERRRLKRGII
ncbi:WhiB family transcriptional regulator [Gordonia sp. CPCC 205515]|uniref:WhiB family transcriptional regulator n=1 Tax=Gordonia sp. CPCC 205515 TaxID=3140791 RepID=UPI003AF37DFE